MEELAIKYVDEIKNIPDFKRLLELKEMIDNNYKKEILAFKTANESYLEASKYPNNYNMELIRNNLIEAKRNLYSKKEVKEYFELENKIQNILDNDFNDIKNSLHSNNMHRCEKLK